MTTTMTMRITNDNTKHHERETYAELRRLTSRTTHHEHEAYMRSSIALYAGRATTGARHMRNYVAS